MDALVMCGGEGRRLDADGEKPLFEIGGRPMIDSVLAALAESRIDATTAVVSPATPRTHDRLESPTIDVDVRTIEAPGDGYVADLQYALDRVERPILTVVADLPLLGGTVVDGVLDRFERTKNRNSLAVCVPAALKRTLGASVDAMRPGADRTLAPTGLNVVAEGDNEETMVSWDARLAVNVNRRSDADLAEALR